MKRFNSQKFFFTVIAVFFLLQSYVTAEDASVRQSAVAIFAGGCFWCMEPPFDALPGVVKTISGYTGGDVDKPSYKEVSDGKTGHYEAVEVTYDPGIVTYEKLLDVFWNNIDPLDGSGQFCDKGDQYRAVIFYRDNSQKQLAKTSLQTVSNKLGVKELATVIKPAGIFYPAEEYHQNYYLKNPYTYKFYRYTCGRDRRLQQIWG